MADPLEWLIVGGGIHGVHLAIRLLGEAGVDPDGVRILDPAPELLASWRRCSGNTGMRHLRSPAVHHLGVDPWCLLRFAKGKRRKLKRKGLFAPPYDRPSVRLFSAHCDDLIRQFGIADLHVQALVEQIEVSDDIVRVRAGGEDLHARRVLLATGGGADLRWPIWAQEARSRGARVHHIFEPELELDPKTWPERVALIGGGITGVQTALRFAKAGRETHLVVRHPFRKHQFDSDPGWVGPKYMRKYRTIDDLNERRRIIDEARHRGSVPPGVLRTMAYAVENGKIQLHPGEPTDVEGEDGLSFMVREQRLEVDGVVLATGFERARPGGPLVDALVDRHSLPCAECGYPVVDEHLRWHPRVFVTGPLAELELGPAARNIVGARRAAERIMPVATASAS